MAAANGATISPQPNRAASSMDGFENEPTEVGIGCCTGFGVMRTSSKE
jgi:hypothetical protein